VADHVIDTNVLLVASAADPDSPFDDSGLPPALQNTVFEWLVAFRANNTRQIVWDTDFKIYGEYRNKLSDQDYGMQLINQKMATARFVPVTYDANGYGVVPEAFADFEPSDRKLLAALLEDVNGTTLVNATDTDWLEIEAQLAAAGARVEHLLEDWLRDKFSSKNNP